MAAALDACGKLAQKVRKKDRAIVRDLMGRVDVLADRIRIVLGSGKSLSSICPTSMCPNGLPGTSQLGITSSAKLTRSGLSMSLGQPGGKGTAPRDADRSIAELLVKARRWWKRLSHGDATIADISREEAINSSWVSRIVRLNFLAPGLVNSILAGDQPAALNAMALS